ncbi:MAG: hypothetical protein ABUS79_32370 [Pseudomonadota bacterium]
MDTEASNVVRVGIPAIGLLVAGLFVWAVAWATRPRPVAGGEESAAPRRVMPVAWAALGTAAWLALTGIAAASGLLARIELRPPPFMLLLVATVVLGVTLGVSRVGRIIAAAVPLWALVLAQGFRLPLELVMHRAALDGVMAHQLSFGFFGATPGPGLNYDIVTGAGAIIVGLLLRAGRAPRGLVVAWNAIGFVCLAGIAGIAVATSPFVVAFGPDSVNWWVAAFPFVWLPAACVAFAIGGQIVVLRKASAKIGRQLSRVSTINRTPAG